MYKRQPKGGGGPAGVLTGLIGHVRSGPHLLAANTQIKQARLTYQGDFGHPCVKANASLLQIPLDSAGGIQTKGAATGQQYRVDPLGGSHRILYLGLAGGRAAAPDIQSGGAHPVTEDDSASSGSLQILGVTDLKAAHIHNPDLLHDLSPFTVSARRAEPYRQSH